MPKLYEYQGKEILRGKGLLIPRGKVASTPEEAKEIANELSGTVVIKSQVLVTGRLEAGGIRFANGAHEAERTAAVLLSQGIKGIQVDKVLVEEKLDIKQEFYAGIVVNDTWKVKGPVLIFSTKGGTGIEQTAADSSVKVVSMNIDIIKGLDRKDAERLISKLGVTEQLIEPLRNMLVGLYQVFRKYSASSVEVNPIVLTKDNKLYAVDCHMAVDEASMFKLPELNIDYPRDIGRVPTELERIAWEMEKEDYRGVGYFVQMAMDFNRGEGVIGFHGIGGGAAMLGADALIRHGLKLANYADTSGNPTASKVYRMVKLIFSQPNIDGYALMGACIANQDQWHHAHALVRALKEELECRPNFPVTILIAGNKETESLEILRAGLKGMPACVELYGCEYVYNVDYVAERMKRLVKEYRSS